MISNLLAELARGEPIKLDQLTLAAETDHKEGRADRKLETSQDCMLPHESVEFSNFRDLRGVLVDGDVIVCRTHFSGEYVSAIAREEGVTGHVSTTLTKDSVLIARWTEDHFGKR